MSKEHHHQPLKTYNTMWIFNIGIMTTGCLYVNKHVTKLSYYKYNINFNDIHVTILESENACHDDIALGEKFTN